MKRKNEGERKEVEQKNSGNVARKGMRTDGMRFGEDWNGI